MWRILTSSPCSRILRHHIFHREARPALDPDPRLPSHSIAICHSRRGLPPHRHRRQIRLPRPPPSKKPQYPQPPPFFTKETTTNVPAVLLQLRRQPHHLHHPRRSLPDARPRLRARRQRRRRQVRRHPLGAAVQLSQRAGGHGAGECTVDFLRVLHSWRVGDVVSDPGDEGAGCGCDGL